MLRCRTGDLALIVISPAPSNLGLPVEVREARPARSGRPGWVIRSTGRAIVSEAEDGTIVAEEFAVCPDAWLLPIRPESEPDEVETEQPLATV